MSFPPVSSGHASWWKRNTIPSYQRFWFSTAGLGPVPGLACDWMSPLQDGEVKTYTEKMVVEAIMIQPR